MNIKSILPNITSIESKAKPDGTKDVKMEESHDRDANGRREQDEQPEKEHLTDEELEQALKKLKNFSGVQDNHLVVKVKTIDEKRVIFIEDLQGKVVRRMTEGQLWSVTQEMDRPTGHLYHKAM